MYQVFVCVYFATVVTAVQHRTAAVPGQQPVLWARLWGLPSNCGHGALLRYLLRTNYFQLTLIHFCCRRTLEHTERVLYFFLVLLGMIYFSLRQCIVRTSYMFQSDTNRIHILYRR